MKNFDPPETFDLARLRQMIGNWNNLGLAKSLAYRPDCPLCGRRMVEAASQYVCPWVWCLGTVEKETDAE